MTNEQINRLVAEELGWKPFRCTDDMWTMVDTAGSHVGKNFRGGLSEDHCWAVCNLNFCEDHNAAAEIRKGIVRHRERVLFYVTLLDVTKGDRWLEINATPRQQAEAFLKMRGKWREG